MFLPAFICQKLVFIKALHCNYNLFIKLPSTLGYETLRDLSAFKSILVLNMKFCLVCTQLTSKAGFTRSSFLRNFFALNYHTWAQFSCSASCQTDASRFFSKQISEAITRIFFAIKAFTLVLRNFFEICRDNSDITHFVDSLLFLVCQNDACTFTKAKSCSYSNK